MTDTESYQYWAFISYSHADTAWARWLHHSLEHYRIPVRLVGRETEVGPVPKKLFPVFRDRDELAGSAELGPALQNALRRSRFQIVIASPNSARSRWVNEEIKFFKSLGRASRVLALIVDGEPNASDKGQPQLECFPGALRFQVGADGQVTGDPAELIAADARKAGDGKVNGLLKLIAGILGLGFNDLRQRELQARNRRLAILASIATAISAVTIVLAVVAYQARNDALRRQQQAEDLLQFMLGDLRGKLEPIGKLAILDAVGQKAMDYFATLDQKDLTDAALASRATALRQIGDVRIKQGDMVGASEAIREALKLDEELVARHPQVTGYLRSMGDSVYSMGNAHYIKGETDLALPWLERYSKITSRLVAIEPANAEWAKLAVEANLNLGAVAFARTELAAAEAYFTKAIAKQRELVEADPGNEEFLQVLSNLHGWMWSVESGRHGWKAAIEHASRQSELHRRQLELSPDNANHRFYLASAGVRALRTESQMGPLEPDSPVLRETLRVTHELTQLDPENIDFANLRVVAANFPIEAHVATDKLHAAESAARQALELARGTYGKAPQNAQALRGLLLMLSQAAKVNLLLNDRSATRALLREAHDVSLPDKPDALQANLRLDIDLLDWWLASGTADETAAQVRAAESVKRVGASGGAVRPDLMLRHAALLHDRAGASRWFSQLTDTERRHPFLREFCRATASCGAPV